MKEYEELIDVLVKMAEINRPAPNPTPNKTQERLDRIQHGISDLMEDAAVAIDDLLTKVGYERQKRDCKQAA